ncbi:MAG: NCS2 family permease [Campylobacteraceae bacterium]|jgi:AGZA family xanthine/uracil permease-like MFS transporter|nr:NCS2 family permease [Campylobacteraceae bacterium]
MDFFKLKEKGSNVKTEAIAGFTTFLTMIYIVPVNAGIMSETGMPYEALVTATALMTIIACIFNGLWSNTPIAMSIGMGLNAFFTFTMVKGMGLPWQSALGIVFISGALFLVLSLTKFRIWVIESVPADLRRAISAGIGTFIAFIGLKQMGIIVSSNATLITLGDLTDKSVLLGLFGIISVVAFSAWRLKGAFILAILLTSVVGWIFGIAEAPKGIVSLPASIAPIAFELDILSAFKLTLIPVIITFLITHMFDSLGTISGVGYRAGLFKENSKELQKTLEADAASSTLSAFLGMSTTTSFVESASGVEEGGRTGLTAVVAGICFIITLFLLPLFLAIPSNAIYSVLVTVGILMFSEVANINFKDFAVAVATFLTVLLMPLTYSIANGLAFGFISFVLIKLAKGEFKDLNFGLIFLALISSIIFIFH